MQIRLNHIKIRNQQNAEKTLLRDISFDLVPNNIFTILGKNGSGKSTLIKSLTSLLDKRFYEINGKIFFEDKDLLTTKYEELLVIRKDKIKYVFQDAAKSFDPLKKIEYYFNIFIKNDSEIDEFFNFFLLPAKNKILNLYPYEISGGMAQRISLILALLAQPRILILDEPTSGIDPVIANLFLLKLKEFVKKNSNSVLLVTQDLNFAEKISDKIAYLSNGKLSAFYSPKDFLENKDDKFLTFLDSHKFINE
jgi:peptide/nickel transport system ATP-binding protein